MKIGLIGLPNSGKTTVFNALTRSQAAVSHYSTENAGFNQGVVQVMDERVRRLSDMYQPKKTVYATLELIDFGGLSGGSVRNGTVSPETLALMRNMDALALVLRHFEDEMLGPPNPLGDMELMEAELLISDLIILESRLERIERGYQRGQKTDALQLEEKALRKGLDHLNQNQPLRELPFGPEEEKRIRGFQFLTQKPLMIMVNSHEDRFGRNPALMDALGKVHPAIEFAGKFEMELSQLEDEAAARMFMGDMGIEASARDRSARLAYDTLGYISFFTVGSDEVRAWNIRKGDTALEAANTIHTDLARGFIRAEHYTYEDMVRFGSEKRVRENGRFRLEGKNYIVEDGDILSIRFNV